MTGGPKSDAATPSENGRSTDRQAHSYRSLSPESKQGSRRTGGELGEIRLRLSSNPKGERLPALVDIVAVAKALGISMRQVRRFVADGQIPFIRVGHLIRFDPDELNDWINARRAGSTQSL
jgi:excisionase family DNA binding protein